MAFQAFNVIVNCQKWDNETDKQTRQQFFVLSSTNWSHVVLSLGIIVSTIIIIIIIIIIITVDFR